MVLVSIIKGIFTQKKEKWFWILDVEIVLHIEINNFETAFGIEADTNVKSIAKSLNLEVHFGSIEDNPF